MALSNMGQASVQYNPLLFKKHTLFLKYITVGYVSAQTVTFCAQTATFIMIQFTWGAQTDRFRTINFTLGAQTDSFVTIKITLGAQTDSFYKGAQMGSIRYGYQILYVI